MNYGQAWDAIDAAEKNPPAPGTPEATQLHMARLTTELHRNVMYLKFDVGPIGDNPNTVGVVAMSEVAGPHNYCERVELDKIFRCSTSNVRIQQIAERCAEQMGRQIFLRKP